MLGLGINEKTLASVDTISWEESRRVEEMRWWVRLGGRIVGWVIAATEEEALAASLVKYPGWGIEEDRSVEK
jgi:hypothetical protein